MMATAVSSNTVLWGQTIIYTCYVVAIMALVAWFSMRITKSGSSRVNPKLFYGFVGFLVAVGVSIHLVTYNTIPWTAVDLHGENLPLAASYEIKVAQHKFELPQEQIEVPCGQLVAFNVVSADLTYGFGLFRPDNSMVLQMQVVPGHDNVLRWKFVQDEVLTIRSTEYSGPEGAQMIVKDAVKVTGCTK